MQKANKIDKSLRVTYDYYTNPGGHHEIKKTCRTCDRVEELRASDNMGNVYCCKLDSLDLGRIHNNVLDTHSCDRWKLKTVKGE